MSLDGESLVVFTAGDWLFLGGSGSTWAAALVSFSRSEDAFVAASFEAAAIDRLASAAAASSLESFSAAAFLASAALAAAATFSSTLARIVSISVKSFSERSTSSLNKYFGRGSTGGSGSRGSLAVGSGRTPGMNWLFMAKPLGPFAMGGELAPALVAVAASGLTTKRQPEPGAGAGAGDGPAGGGDS